MSNARHLYSDWTVPGAEERTLTEAKTGLTEVAALVESASKVTTRAEMDNALRTLKALVAKLS